jgi:hypothetical protein
VYFVPVDSLVGGAILGAASVTLPGYATAQRVMVPASGVTVRVYQRGTTTPVACYEDQHGLGTAVAQPLTTNTDGLIVDGAGARVYVGQPAELDVNLSGGGMPAPRTLPVGGAGDAAGTITKAQVVATGLAPADIGAAVAAAPVAAAVAMAVALGS